MVWERIALESCPWEGRKHANKSMEWPVNRLGGCTYINTLEGEGERERRGKKTIIDIISVVSLSIRARARIQAHIHERATPVP